MSGPDSGTEQKPSDIGWSNVADRPIMQDVDWQGDYEILRDTIIAAFNPPDCDQSEPSLMTEALDRAWSFILTQPCVCPPPDSFGDVEVCRRCDALGRCADVKVSS